MIIGEEAIYYLVDDRFGSRCMTDAGGDSTAPTISCGSSIAGKFNAGDPRSVGALEVNHSWRRITLGDGRANATDGDSLQ